MSALSFLLLLLPASAVRLLVPPTPQLRASAPLCMSITYPEYIKEKQAKDAASSDAKTFGASSSLIEDPELIKAAEEAAGQAGHLDQFSPSQIVIAFNSWKLSEGVSYESKEDAATALRNFAADLKLITTHLELAESALFSSETFNAFGEDDLTAYLDSEWRLTWQKAAEARKHAEAQRAKALAGQAAAEDKMKQAVENASQNEKAALTAAEAAYSRDMLEIEAKAGQERARLAQQLASVAAEEKETREAALKRLTKVRKEASMRAATSVATAQADREGAMHMFKQMEQQALSSMENAEKELSNSLKLAKEQEERARLAAEKKASIIVAAQSEAKALLELLKKSKEEAAKAAAQMEEEKREMESAVELANKRVRKAKLAAAAALEDI
ncbi:MAG: hypothetical protein SGPRY_002301 [Prymnesium sp.]